MDGGRRRRDGLLRIAGQVASLLLRAGFWIVATVVVVKVGVWLMLLLPWAIARGWWPASQVSA